MRDNWCVGYSARYTVAVWVGNFDGTPMWDVSGVTGAAPLWLEVMNALQRNAPSTQPPLPRALERQRIRFEDGVEAERDELFLAGTAMSSIARKPQARMETRIMYPSDGQIIAVDPDIPEAAQRVRFTAEGHAEDQHWRLNERPVDGEFWQPLAGRWRLTVHDGNGRELDAIRFEVRGNAVNQDKLTPVSPETERQP
jgi:penicillin-binding protein 1C